MKNSILSRGWLKILAFGILLFLISEVFFLETANPVFLNIIIYVGSFIVPVTFVTYFYEYVRDSDISRILLTACFIIGGLIGVVTALLLEYRTISNLNIATLFAVAVIEECAKLIFPIVMLVMWRYRHEADGLLFGVAAGMGFAAFETVGYALTYWSQSGGDIGILQQVLVIRGLSSPAGHAAWTGLVCATLWNQRQRFGHPFKLVVLGALGLAVILHWTWNIVNSLNVDAPSQFSIYAVSWAIIIAISLSLLVWRFRKVRKDAIYKTNNPDWPTNDMEN